VLLLSDAELLCFWQLKPQEFHQLSLVDIVLQGHRWLSGDLAGGKLSPSRDIQLLLHIEEHLPLCMQLVPRPLAEPCLARGPNILN
jgi:hypothetical protein